LGCFIRGRRELSSGLFIVYVQRVRIKRGTAKL
jgi:hypothetical protein